MNLKLHSTLKIQYLILFFCFNFSFSQTFWTDDFEMASPSSGTRSASNHSDVTNGSNPGVCGLGDYFYRISAPSDPPNGVSVTFSNYSGTSYWRGEDLDGCIANPDFIDFTGIDISGKSDIAFKGLFGANESNLWETSDYINIFYKIDSGSFISAVSFRGNGSGRISQDTNNDGIGDGALLEASMQEFYGLISGTGNTLDLRIEVSTDGGSEEFAFDNFRLEENSSLSIDGFIQIEDYLKIYPNPSSGYVVIASNKSISEIEIYNTLGQHMLKLKSNNLPFRKINLSNLKPGIYVLKAYAVDDSHVVRKFIIE